MALGETGYEFLKKEATIDDRGSAHVTQKKYMEFMSSNGLTKEIMEAYKNAHAELVNGMYMFNKDQLIEQIDRAKKEGRDPAKEKMSTAVNIPCGNIALESFAKKSYPVPKQPGQTVDKYMVNKLTFTQTRLFDKELCSTTESELQKKLGMR